MTFPRSSNKGGVIIPILIILLLIPLLFVVAGWVLLRLHGNKLNWTFDTLGQVSSMPIISNDVVFFGTRKGYFYAVDVETGKEKWMWRSKSKGEILPRGIHMETVLVDTDYDGGYAFDIKTGEVKWTTLPDIIEGVGAAIGEGVLFRSHAAFNVETGQRIWGLPFEEVKHFSSGGFYPLIDNGVVYVAFRVPCSNGGTCSYFFAFHLLTGEVKWKFELKGNVISKPMVYRNVVYLRSDEGYLYGLDTKTGENVWKFRAEGRSDSLFAIASGNVYDTNVDGQLYAVDLKTKKIRWILKVDGVPSALAVSDGVVYLGSSRFYAIDAETGEEKWSFRPWGWIFPDSVSSDITIGNDTLYFGTTANKVYAISIKGNS